MKTKVLGLLAAGLITGPMSADAGVLFSDNFDNDTSSSTLNFNALINWTVSGGTVDYIRSGGFGISCVGGSGGCVDMDGSTGDAGRITSRQVFDFDDGVEYFIDLALSGSQRSGNDSIQFGLVRESDSALFGANIGPLAFNTPFTTIIGSFLGSAVPGSWRLYVEGIGGDNIGLILDNYVLRDNRANEVPEPGSLALIGLGLAGLGLSRRRKAN